MIRINNAARIASDRFRWSMTVNHKACQNDKTLLVHPKIKILSSYSPSCRFRVWICSAHKAIVSPQKTWIWIRPLNLFIYIFFRSFKFQGNCIFICVWKINTNLIGLKWHEGEYMMTEFTFLSLLYLINTVSWVLDKTSSRIISYTALIAYISSHFCIMISRYNDVSLHPLVRFNTNVSSLPKERMM